jgi:quercetin dioxygenase-like cupin family protein
MQRLQRQQLRRRQPPKKDYPTTSLPDNPSGMFGKQSGRGYRPALDGIERKTLVHGDKTLMTEFRLRKGAILPRHSHPHEQTGYLVKGRIRLLMGTQEYEAQVGDSWCIPGGVEHRADILEDSVAIELFSPVRDDYLRDGCATA